MPGRDNLAWLWRWRIAFWFAPPLCEACGYSARLRVGGAWLCERHFVGCVVHPRMVGIRPRLFIYSRRAAARVFKTKSTEAGAGILAVGLPKGDDR